MYRKDYFLKLTQQFAQMLARLMNLKEKGEPEKALEVIDEAYAKLFPADRATLETLEERGFPEVLREKFMFSDEQLEILARLMFEEEALCDDSERSRQLLRKSVAVLQYLNEQQKLYSFEREDLINKIQDRLNS